MTMTKPVVDERVNSVFIKAIGSLALASYDLQSLRAARIESAESETWDQFARHLLGSSLAVVEGAAGSQFAGNTITVRRDGSLVPVGPDHVDKLTTRIRQHVRVGIAMGIGEREGSDLSLTA